MQAVITGDIVKSAGLKNRDEALKSIHAIFKAISKAYGTDFELYRGDAIQGICQAKDAFLITMYIKSALLTKGISIRLAIGIGPIEYPREKLEESDGTAFKLSGRMLDQLKGRDIQFMINTEDQNFNNELNLSCKLFDYIISAWSIKSAEVITHSLQHKNQNEIAALLQISQPAVNKRLKTAQWHMLELFNQRYQQILTKLP